MWQQIFEEINAEIKDPNFVILCAAQDVGGEAAAGPIFDAANPTYIQVVDADHTISSAFNFVNVPSAAWIDETGTIVRIDEGTYSRLHTFGEGEQSITFGNDVYAPALKDWVRNGARSEHVQSSATIAGNIRELNYEEQKGNAAFRLANLFRAHGAQREAEHYWEMARALNPDSVNFIRQDLTLSEEGSAGETFLKLRDDYIRTGKDYYRPLDI